MNNLFFGGRGSINNLRSVLSGFRAGKVLLVTGKRSYDECPIREKVELNLENSKVLRHCDFEINPKVEDLIRGASLIASFKPDALVAVGGGSVLDTAKMLSILPADPKSITSIIKGGSKVPTRTKQLILIPTTSGSGSEATHFAVAYIRNVKYSIASKYLLPDAVILDSEFTDTMSKELTAITAFDAFSQAIESFWSLGATKESKKYAVESIGIVLDVFEKLINIPGPSVRDKMMRASFLSGKAINISKTTAPHALSYALTQNFGIPHGLAVMLLLPAFFRANAAADRLSLNAVMNFDEYLKRINELKTMMGVASTNEAVSKISKMILFAGFQPHLRDYGVNNTSDIKLLVDSINIDRLSNNPVIINREQLVSLLETVY